MAKQSKVSPDLWLLDEMIDFKLYAAAMIEEVHRSLAILTRDLDFPVYGNAEFIEVISAFSRSSRNSTVQILVKDTKPAIASNHPLIRLVQRLPSKMHVRKMTLGPNNKDMAFMLGDSDKVLFKNDDNNYRGFFNRNAPVEVKRLREEFNYLWQYAEPEPEFQLLQL